MSPDSREYNNNHGVQFNMPLPTPPPPTNTQTHLFLSDRLLPSFLLSLIIHCRDLTLVDDAGRPVKIRPQKGRCHSRKPWNLRYYFASKMKA